MSRIHSSLATVCKQVFLGFGALKLASLIKINFIVGSQAAFFSGTSVAMPLLGTFLGTALAGITLCVQGLSVITRLSLLKFLAYHIPGFCAAAYWNTQHWLMRCALPLVCMVLFIAHPIGGQAFAYSFYWLIPVTLYVVQAEGVFWSALGSTFIAHAVGSIIWLYTIPMTADMWLGLIPVVAVERLLFATGMVVAYGVVIKVGHMWARLKAVASRSGGKIYRA